MKLATTVMCATMLGLFGCSSGAGQVPDGSSDDALRHTNGSKELSCEASSGGAKLATVEIKDGKYALVAFKPAGKFFAVSGINGAITSSANKTEWSGGNSSLKIDGSGKGTWERDGHSTNVSCKESTTEEKNTFRAANALTDYASEIDGLAETVVGEMSSHAPKAYMIYAVANDDRDSLSLGNKVRDSQGKTPGTDDDDSKLDENDLTYGAMSAAYNLGGGDDYGEWFQGASDGISLIGDLAPALKNGAKAGFIAREKVTALASVVDSTKPSAVEITVGPFTYYLPDAFPK